jgi:hypothetical protein
MNANKKAENPATEDTEFTEKKLVETTDEHR